MAIFSKRHYEFLAEHLASSHRALVETGANTVGFNIVLARLIHGFERDNPGFDSSLFRSVALNQKSPKTLS